MLANKFNGLFNNYFGYKEKNMKKIACILQLSLLLLSNLITTSIVLADCVNWSRGNRYSTGDIVEYNGQNYIADSYNQAERKWMWRPTNQSCTADITATSVESDNYITSVDSDDDACGDPWVKC